jgi:hypothetical protein
MFDAFIITFSTLFLIIYFMIKKKFPLYKIVIIWFISIFIFQYIFINSNPYRNFKTNKLTILDYIPENYKPRSELFNPKKKYKFPFILKPTICTRTSRDVKLIKNKIDLKLYLKKNKLSETMYQEFVDSNYEVGILYERNPLHKKGKIKSIIMRKFLQNNKFKLKKKFAFIYDSTEFVNLEYLITPKLNMIIDNISKQIPNFYVGRYDIRAHTLEQLINGKFYILEANGTMGFDLKYQCYKKNYINFYGFLDKMRWIFIRFYYGLINILTFNCVNVNIIFISIYNAINCLDLEKLFCVYS